MRRRFLVTGGSGFVAGSVITQGTGTWEIHVLSRHPAPVGRPGLVWHRVDRMDADGLSRAFREAAPQAVIHTAAIADIDYCQAHREEARRVNVEMTRVLADLCRENHVRLVYTSTDTVFDGRRGNYREDEPPAPVNYYGQTKAEAERLVAAQEGDWVIARLALVVGLPVLAPGNSFLARMMTLLGEGRQVGVPPDEIRTPIDVITLGRALLELADGDVRGYIHLAGNDVLNRLDMARRIAERLGYPKDRVVPNDPTKIPGRAPRPRDVSLDNRKARSLLKTPMQGLDGGLDLILFHAKDPTG